MIDLDALEARANEVSVDCPRVRDWHRYCEATAPAAILELVAEVRRLREENARHERSSLMLANIMHNNTVAMQAAWIEWQHGEGADGAMEWIENTLAGPGLIPEDDEPHATEAQAYFDANFSQRSL
ncbi:hypothetical protein AB4Y32_16085 [Paraburkholderia phymatum]|uniref:Uncharacterized protein n=1 Tax=Paraburkholderia phymatum TaxID=148447 RepID=A0ACC6U142_9BURK